MKTKSFKTLRATLRVIWIAAGAALVLGVVFSNFPPDGRLEAHTFPGEPSPFVTAVRPASRVDLVDSGKGLVYVVRDEPAYFGLAAPPFFRRATVRIEYLNEGQPRFALGGRTDAEEWRFDLRELETTEETDDGWTVGEASFELGRLTPDARRDVQMVLSLPAMQEGNDAPLRIRRIEVAYERPPLTLESIIEALGKKIGYEI